jgi:hypothetical protein
MVPDGSYEYKKFHLLATTGSLTSKKISEQAALSLELENIEQDLLGISAGLCRDADSANWQKCQEMLENLHDIEPKLGDARELTAAAIAPLMPNKQSIKNACGKIASNVRPTIDGVLGTQVVDKAPTQERYHASPMHCWISQKRSCDPWCILGVVASTEQQKKGTRDGGEENEQNNERLTSADLSSDDLSETWSLKANTGSDVERF